MRWLLIDRFTEIRKGESARALRSVTRSEGALTDDYPAYPVMPAALLLEMMAQTGGVLAGTAVDFAKEVVLAKITDAEFHRSVTPPATLEIEATLSELGESAAVTRCRITRDSEPVADAVIFFGLFEGIEGGRQVVFSRDFMESFAIRQTMGAAGPRA